MLCNNCGNLLESFQKFCPKCGAQAPAQYQPPTMGSAYTPPQSPIMGGQMGPPPRKSSCGKIILIAVVILVLLALGAVAAIYYGYRYAENALKTSEAYTTAVATLKENPEVKDKLGDIVDTGFPLGAFSQNADGTGNAAFTMSVQGSKGTGQYAVELVRRNRVWKVRTGSVRLSGGDTILLGDSLTNDGGPDDANTNTNPTDNPANSSPGKTTSSGILNAKAISLPQPVYPPAAKAVRASGKVVVHVTVDEEGDVISARAISGHPLLRAAAEAAAREAKFSPTKLSGKPIKVSGLLHYNFASE